ncbi:glycosylated lysosomal membrane protein [Alosa sapidissima]|uniref:glycosylated lysosomal membrane protein n=1 Tax=Alosa sapidissima TaxID=34773 RepID=UPI001C0813BD|nr:glycosylated lysosomal membrane protein [Alosa sapidissima]
MDIGLVQSSTFILCLLIHCTSGLTGDEDDYRRKVSMELNPGQSEPSSGVDVVHVQAVGSDDTLHFLFCNHRAPALMLVHTNSSFSNVHINWTAFLNGNYSGSLKVVPESSVQFSSALVFTRLWEYDDVNDTADPEHLPPSSFFPSYELQDFSWNIRNATYNLTTHTATLCGRNSSNSFMNGFLCLAFSAFESRGRDSEWPGLLHNANSSQLHVWLDNVIPRSNQSRFILEVQSVSSAEQKGQVDVLKSIDDEYTPSIFKVSQWVSSPSNASSEILGYTQWKPVAYRTEHPKFEDATPCRHSDPVLVSELPPSGWVQALFRDGLQTSTLNITFSIAGDPFYNTTNYLSWSVLVGLGNPPQDSFSPLVLTIMAVGLGTPLALILFGGVGAGIFKRNQHPQGYEPIN